MPKALRTAAVSAAGPIPDDIETRRIFALIGKPLTRMEFSDNGEVYLEFNPFGSITVRPRFDQEILTSIRTSGDTIKPPRTSVPEPAKSDAANTEEKGPS